jgi:hypothetical protein
MKNPLSSIASAGQKPEGLALSYPHIPADTIISW